MKLSSLGISGVWVIESNEFEDNRGSFHEWYRSESLQLNEVEKFELKQANCSTSKKGTIRGIHFAKYPPGQRKYVKCFSGKILDVVVDLRVDSSNFGKWESVELSAENNKAIFIPNGVGHAFVALEDQSVVAYLCDQPYTPENEFGINPMDPDIGIKWPENLDFLLSEKDENASTFKDSLSLLQTISIP